MKTTAIVAAAVIAAGAGGAAWYVYDHLPRQIAAAIDAEATKLPSTLQLSYGKISVDPFAQSADIKDIVLVDSASGAQIELPAATATQPAKDGDLPGLEVFRPRLSGLIDGDHILSATADRIQLSGLTEDMIAHLNQISEDTSLLDISRLTVGLFEADNFRLTNNTDNSVIALGEIRLHDVENSLLTGLKLADLHVREPDGTSLTFGEVSIENLPLLDSDKTGLENYRQFAASSVPFGFAMNGIQVRSDEVTADIGALTLEALSFDTDSFSVPVPTHFAVSMKDHQGRIAQGSELRQFEIPPAWENAVSSSRVEMTLDPASGDFRIVDNSGSAAGLFNADFTLAVGGLPIEFLIKAAQQPPADQSAAMQAFVDTSLQSVQMRLQDDGGLADSVAFYAELAGVPMESVAPITAGLMRNATRQFATAEINTIIDTFEAFLADPNGKELTVKLAPETPFKMIHAMTAGSPDKLVSLLGPEVTLTEVSR